MIGGANREPAMPTEQKIIKVKAGLLELAKQRQAAESGPASQGRFHFFWPPAVAVVYKAARVEQAKAAPVVRVSRRDGGPCHGRAMDA
jgi:hypothetical protein